MSDFTKHKDPMRMSRYVGRHLGKGGFGKLPKKVETYPKILNCQNLRKKK